MLKHLILKYAPEVLLEWAKSFRKNQRRKALKKQEAEKSGISKFSLLADLQRIGIKKGDSLLVHSSLSKIGFVEGGPKTVIEALQEAVGEEGTLLFPAFPAKGRNKTHLEEHPFFDVRNTPSQMGSITEYFRGMKGVLRSLHPTDSIAAKGPLAEYY